MEEIDNQLVNSDDLDFLRDLARETVAKCRTKVHIDGKDYPVYLASGSRQYPAFWTRDSVWNCLSGLVEDAEMESMLQVMALTQNGPTARILKHGLTVPAWSIADHMLCENGGAIFFPGTYSAGGDQGEGRYGKFAAQDANYMFIELAYLYLQQTGNVKFLDKEMAGTLLLDRLENAFGAPEYDPETELAFTTAETRAVAFSDAIVKTGYLLDGSILRWRASMRLAGIFKQLDMPEKSFTYREKADLIKKNLPLKLWNPTGPDEGWLRSASGIGCQDCVRGTSFALVHGILGPDYAMKASHALASAAAAPALDVVPQAGQITYQGHIRHLRNGEHWQQTPMRPETYQNGGYWGMFTGWFVRAVEVANPDLARATAQVYVEHMRKFNFVNGEDKENAGAPWEWIHPDGARIGPVYAPTITLVLKGFATGFTVE
jgi:hypothetical protein